MNTQLWYTQFHACYYRGLVSHLHAALTCTILDTGLSDGAVAGIVIGAVVGVVLLIVVVVLIIVCCIKRKQRKGTMHAKICVKI